MQDFLRTELSGPEQIWFRAILIDLQMFAVGMAIGTQARAHAPRPTSAAKPPAKGVGDNVARGLSGQDAHEVLVQKQWDEKAKAHPDNPYDNPDRVVAEAEPVPTWVHEPPWWWLTPPWWIATPPLWSSASRNPDHSEHGVWAGEAGAQTDLSFLELLDRIQQIPAAAHDDRSSNGAATATAWTTRRARA